MLAVRLLGTVELLVQGQPARIKTEKARCLLAVLALDAGRSVSLDTLADRLWDGNLPGNPANSLHSHVSKLNKALRVAAEDEGDGPSARIVSHGRAYTLELDPQSIDCHHFRRLTQCARAAAEQGDDTQALAQLAEADALWTGEPLAGLRGEWAHRARTTLLDDRLAATLTRVEVELRMHRFTELVAELSSLTATRPSDQSLVAHLMIALHGAGRQDQALALYQTTFRLLYQELGTRPGPELTDLHARILDGIPAATLVPGARAKVTAPAAAPAAAPSTLPQLRPLVGREQDLAELALAITGARGVRALSVTGTGGVGKTVLALHLTERLRDHFPDGQHLVRLHGFSVSQQPLTTEAALLELLRVIGIPAVLLPAGHLERVELWFSMLREHRYVIVLDDVAESDQVRELLPVTSNSLLILTSRLYLSELPEAHPHEVGVLPISGAVELFQHLVGERAADQDVVRDIIARTDCLPLAIEILATRFKSRATWTLEQLAHRLSQASPVIDEFHYRERDLTRYLEVSYRTLTPDHQRAFRLLGLHPGPHFDRFAAAALLGTPLRESERAVEALLDGHLIQEPSFDSYAFHDLLHEFAAGLAALESSATERAAATDRLTTFALSATDRADRLLYPHRLRLPLAGSAPASGPAAGPDLNSPAQARSWLRHEQTCLLAIQRQAMDEGDLTDAHRLTNLLAGFLDAECFWADAVRLHQAAAEHWHSTGERVAEVRSLLDLGYAQQRGAQYVQAEASAARALSIARAAEDLEGVAEVLNQSGVMHARAGDSEMALNLQQQALAVCQDSGNLRQRDRIVNNIGISHMHLGHHARAVAAYEEALAGFNSAGNSRLAAQLLSNLGQVREQVGDIATAHAAYERALRIGDGVLSELETALIQNNLAPTFRLPAELDQARALQEAALATFRRLGERRSLAEGLLTLGGLYQQADLPYEAVAMHRDALALTTSIGADFKQARALIGLGIAEATLGRAEAARRHLTAAANLARHIQAPVEETQAHAALARLSSRHEHGFEFPSRGRDTA